MKEAKKKGLGSISEPQGKNHLVISGSEHITYFSKTEFFGKILSVVLLKLKVSLGSALVRHTEANRATSGEITHYDFYN